MVLSAGGSPRRSRGLRGSLQQRHFYEEADPDRALAMLEDEMSLDMEEALEPGHTRTDSTMRTARGLAKLRELLEKECEAQVFPPCPACRVHQQIAPHQCRPVHIARAHVIAWCGARMGMACKPQKMQP